MKTIGLIGGMSWESTLHYYRIINEEVKRKLGGFHSAKCVLVSVDFEEIERLQREGRWEEMGIILNDAAINLEQAGAEFFILCTNTMHKVATQIQNHVNIPFLHIAEATAKQIKQQHISAVGLLGTKYTMEQEFYKSKLESNGLHILIPNDDERVTIHRIIFDELVHGIVNEGSRNHYKSIMNKLTERGAEGIILGCTEIGLLVNQEDAIVPLFDTTLIHAQEAVRFSFGEV
ncbi:MAG: aspartate/glutamate racemase family protein [Ignavibacteriae bacterium]|nr:aspartate/glutamate racemase family protein [Ignavibacteriota bacterium]